MPDQETVMSDISKHGNHSQVDISKAGTFKLGARSVKRLGYGAMQLAGPGVFGPPKDREGGSRRAAGGRGERRQPHRHERFLWPARHQPDHSRGAASLSR